MFSANDFIPSGYSHSLAKGSFSWSAPSNIALVKYWGKKANHPSLKGELAKQIPANPSVSFTLSNCKTITKLAFTKKDTLSLDCARDDTSSSIYTSFSFDLLFEGKPKEDFKPKIQQFFERVVIYLPFLNQR